MVILHVLLLVLLMQKSQHEVAPTPVLAVQARLIERIRPALTELPPMRPQLRPPPPPSLPLPRILITEPTRVAVAVAPVIRIAPPAVPAETSSGGGGGDKGEGRVWSRMDLRGSARSCREPLYPPALDVLKETVLVAISLLIGPDGRVQDVRLDASSGQPQLDQAVIESFSRCKYIGGNTRGVPDASWFSVKYRWVAPRVR